MNKMWQTLLLLLVMTIFSTCGAADNGGNDTGETTTAASIVLTASSPQLSLSEPVILTAYVRSADNVLLANEKVRFTADQNATIQVLRDLTDESGTAQAQLSTPLDKSNRTINVRVYHDLDSGIEDSMTVDAEVISLTISGADSAIVGESAEFSLLLQDQDGSGVGGRTISLSSQLGNSFSDAAPVTDASGRATFGMTPQFSGSELISASGAGASASKTLDIIADTADRIKFNSPDANTEVNLDTDEQVTVQWTRADGSPVTGSITFSTTRGDLSDTDGVSKTPLPVSTDTDGVATAYTKADNAGPALIKATSSTGLSTSREILFVATTPTHMTLQAQPAVIGTNDNGAIDEQSEIIAVIRDANNNLVKNQQVFFNLHDVSGGRLSDSSGTTDVFGRTGTTYIAGASPSGLDGARITATVADTSPVVSRETGLTVAEKQLFVTLGTGGDIISDGVNYRKPYGVRVTDAAGGPVANAQVSLSIFSSEYFKGFYTFIDPIWERTDTIRCESEDINQDGILDPAADLNQNNMIDPGNVATLSAGSVITDQEGMAAFELVYFQSHAAWVAVELTARAVVSGTESTAKASFRLPVAPSDLTNEEGPAGNPSPFGVSEFCSDTN